MTRFLSTEGEPRAFIVISSMRSGSTLLVRHLRQLSRAACFGEILRADFPESEGWRRIVKRLDLPADARAMHAHHVAGFWDLVLSRALQRKRWVGSKIFSDHRRGEPVWERFADVDHRVFHLWRDSTFDTYISLELARLTGEWQAPMAGSEPPPAQAPEWPSQPRIVFDADAYRRYRGHIRDDVESVRARYGTSARYLELEYGELTDLAAMASMLESLFGERVRLKERLDRQRPRPKIEYVANPDAAAPFIADSLRSGFAEER